MVWITSTSSTSCNQKYVLTLYVARCLVWTLSVIHWQFVKATRTMPNPLEPRVAWQIDRLRRQFFQLVDPKELAAPAMETLKLSGVQAEIYATMFNEATCSFPSPDKRYKWRVLKKIVNLLEQSVIDPEEDVSSLLSSFSYAEPFLSSFSIFHFSLTCHGPVIFSRRSRTI